ncbi:hypothetical protein B0H19DRAFT_1271306 [Mycena capillaripes]|nr:hypothetical protein B0H19DRAFT_1271306 [Mycena capillaripes]
MAAILVTYFLLHRRVPERRSFFQFTQELEATDSPRINIVPTATLTAILEAALSYSMEDLGNDYVAANA